MATIALPLVPLVSTNLLREAVVAESAEAGGDVVEKVGGLDIAVDDLLVMGRGEGAEEAGEIGAKEREGGGAVVGLLRAERGQRKRGGERREGTNSEILVTVEGHDGDDLVLVTKGGDEVGNIVGSPVRV